MYFLRPLQEQDFEGIVSFAMDASEGLTSLPKDREFLLKKLKKAAAVMKNPEEFPLAERNYLFTLKRTDHKQVKVLGLSGIRALVDSKEKVIEICKGTDGESLKWSTLPKNHSELTSLYVDRSLRETGCGRLTSFSRILYIHRFISDFQDYLLAQLRGVCDQQGDSPFWENLMELGQHPYPMSFTEAHHLRAIGNNEGFKYLPQNLPLVSELNPLARQTLATPHPHTVGAERLLMRLGFEKLPSIDAFDAGPHMSCLTHKVSFFKHVRRIVLGKCEQRAPVSSDQGVTYLVTNEERDFRAIQVRLEASEEEHPFRLTEEEAEVLQVSKGDTIQVLALTESLLESQDKEGIEND